MSDNKQTMEVLIDKFAVNAAKGSQSKAPAQPGDITNQKPPTCKPQW